MKRWLAAVLVLVMMAVPCRAEEGQPAAVALAAPSAVLMTLDGQVLFEKDAHAPREPASVTKVMTMLLVCEAVDQGRVSLKDPVTASAYAASMRRVAQRLDVPLIDLYQMSGELIDAWGDEHSKRYFMHLPAGVYPHFPNGLTDNTHLQPEGAMIFGGLIARGLKELGGIYAELLCDEYGQWQEEKGE